MLWHGEVSHGSIQDDVATLKQLAGQLINDASFEQAAAVARRITELARTDPAGCSSGFRLALGETDEAEPCLRRRSKCDGASEYCKGWRRYVCSAAT